MRRILSLFLIFILLALPVSAFSGITSGSSSATVQSDGRCQVSLNFTLSLDTLPSALAFPIPQNAAKITLNGQSVSAPNTGNARHIDLLSLVSAPGTYTFSIQYEIADVIVRDEEENLYLTLELLSGFEYPVETFRFTVQLPGEVAAQPQFSSMYYPSSIETWMDIVHNGDTISCQVNQRLQDHEKLTMTLAVEESMFPQPITKRWSMDAVDLWMLGLGIATILYWLIFMRCLPKKPIRRTTPPDGITAGQIPCRLIGQGPDLTMMVLSWAQMGYLLIRPEENGRVLLQKRMDMGSERNDFEVKYFRKLFGKRATIDGTSYGYGRLCRKAALERPGMQFQYRRFSGNPLFLRILAAAIGAVGGISLARAFAQAPTPQILLSILLAVVGFVVSWAIQNVSKSLHLRSKAPLLVGIAAAIFWFILSYAGGEWNVALSVIPAQVIAGFAAFYGGRRTETGNVNLREILGLRRYLKTMTPEEMKRNMRIDPQYFYDIAPFALALGVDRKFAQLLKKTRLPECPYLVAGVDGHLTGPEWNQLLRETVSALDAAQHRLLIDKLLGR